MGYIWSPRRSCSSRKRAKALHIWLCHKVNTSLIKSVNIITGNVYIHTIISFVSWLHFLHLHMYMCSVSCYFMGDQPTIWFYLQTLWDLHTIWLINYCLKILLLFISSIVVWPRIWSYIWSWTCHNVRGLTREFVAKIWSMNTSFFNIANLLSYFMILSYVLIKYEGLSHVCG